jgi:hypothetical protein
VNNPLDTDIPIPITEPAVPPAFREALGAAQVSGGFVVDEVENAEHAEDEGTVSKIIEAKIIEDRPGDDTAERIEMIWTEEDKPRRRFGIKRRWKR